MSLTLVTGLWDIGRGNIKEGWSRSFDHYLEKFDQLLKVETNMIIFGDEELEKFVLQRRSESNTQFIKRGLEWFKNNEFYNQIQNIRTNPNWYTLSGWLKDSTQATLEMYNPLVMSKMFLLHDAKILDKFDSTKLFWIDAGITNTVHYGYFTHDKVLDKINSFYEKFLFVCFPYDAENEVHGFQFDKLNEYAKSTVKKVARGGFFGGTKESISTLNSLYYDLMSSTLKKGLMGTEESLFSILTYRYPNLIESEMIESNGLMYKFFEDVKNKNIDSIQIKNNDGVGLYVLTYNSPDQFETLIKSMMGYDSSFITNTKKFLLDNSTDLSTTPKYLELCEKYGFEHIKKDNIGIMGGRVFIAEHFDQTNLGYYYFFEDDMFFVNKKTNETCKSGFNRVVNDLNKKVQEILNKENLDFIKLNFSEFYGTHEKQWSWYNVPQSFRETHWPNNKNLPIDGLDPNSPNLEFKNIKTHFDLPYATGEIYLSNWPILMSKKGNYKCYLKTKFKYPFEQTLMSQCYQETIKGNVNPAVLLISPTEHNRFDFYPHQDRKEC